MGLKASSGLRASVRPISADRTSISRTRGLKSKFSPTAPIASVGCGAASPAFAAAAIAKASPSEPSAAPSSLRAAIPSTSLSRKPCCSPETGSSSPPSAGGTGMGAIAASYATACNRQWPAPARRRIPRDRNYLAPRAADRGRLPTPQCAGLFLSAFGQTGDAIEQARPTALLWYLAGFRHFCGGGESGATCGRFFSRPRLRPSHWHCARWQRQRGPRCVELPARASSSGASRSSPPACRRCGPGQRARPGCARSSPRTGRRTWPGAVVWPPPMRRISPMKCAACRASRSCVAASSARSLAMVAACWSACAWAEPSRAFSAMRLSFRPAGLAVLLLEGGRGPPSGGRSRRLGPPCAP